MELLTEWFADNSYMVNALQIALDILVIAMLVYYMTKPAKNVEGTAAVMDSLQKIIDETRQISDVFDKNLHERQDLMQGILRKLDQEIREAEIVYRKLDSLRKNMETTSQTQISPFVSSENQDILRLAQTGMDAKSIAHSLKKPLGEVELILNLARISINR
jgi:hypothetical protein